jgi:uncharacterized protein YdhG (YjbR/CyaY superfamily)
MAKAADTASVRAYVAAMPPGTQAAVERLRALILAAAPALLESRSYGIIGYKLDGRPFIYCGGFARHVALYPVTAAMRRDHADAIAPFVASTGTLKFPLDQPLPVALIKRLLKTRVGEMRAAAEPAAGGRRRTERRSGRPSR